MFVLLFRYVFGGAIHPGGGLSYIDFLMAGIFIQSVGFGGIGTAVGLAEDLQKGLIERFRALPMARSAVLAGRTTADLVRNVFVLLLMTGVGALVGFDFPNGALGFVAACALVLFFAYALLWGFAVIGLVASNSETAQVMAFPILFPLIFASPAFVPLTSMPGWLRWFATNQPIGAVIDATRSLMLGGRYVPGSTSGHVARGIGVVRRVPGGAGAAGRVALPPQHLSRTPAPGLRSAPTVSTGGPVVGVRAVARAQRGVADRTLRGVHRHDLAPLAEGHVQLALALVRLIVPFSVYCTGRWGRDVVT